MKSISCASFLAPVDRGAHDHLRQHHASQRAQITSAHSGIGRILGDQPTSWLIAEFISSRWRREDSPGPPRVARRIRRRPSKSTAVELQAVSTTTGCVRAAGSSLT